jgi:hypothetical protein
MVELQRLYAAECRFRPTVEVFPLSHTGKIRPMFWLPCLLFLLPLSSPAQVPSVTTAIDATQLKMIVERMEAVQRQNPALSQPYETTRKYKIFHGDDVQPIGDVLVRMEFVPPATTSYKIIQSSGSSRAEGMVRRLLDQQIEGTKNIQHGEITQANYDFVFLRRQNFGVVPEYVLGIFPKRKERQLLLGEIWVDASTFHIRRIEGVPAKSPSFWLSDVYITVQFAQLRAMWVPVTFDAIATVRFLGRYTLAGVNVTPPVPLPPDSNVH